jgi:hypothetical protein
LIIGIGAANDVLPPLPRHKQWRFHLPLEDNAPKRAGVAMGDKVIEKLLLPWAEVRRFKVKALPGITNDVNVTSHPIEKPNRANAVTEGIMHFEGFRREGDHCSWRSRERAV